MASSKYVHHFTERNIPFGIACCETHGFPQAVTRIGNTVLFLRDLAADGLFSHIDGLNNELLAQKTLNDFAALPQSIHRTVRAAIQETFRDGGLDAFPTHSREDVRNVAMHLPVHICDFTNFSCSLEHVRNAGRIITKNANPPPAFFNYPIGYQGRTSSIVVSGTKIERPMGQYRDKTTNSSVAVFGPSKEVDYEVEFAAIIGGALPMRQRLNAVDADNHIFGFVLLNDWSARDIQSFEMTPLGPLNGKNLGTTISPWIVTPDALESFRVPGPPRVLPVPSYLNDPGNWTYAIRMQVEITAGPASTVTGESNVQTMYWTARQMIAHVVSAGAALRTGDILATGTISGPEDEAKGCLLEVTEGGTTPFKLADGTQRTYLQDGDIVRISAIAGGPSSGVGWGECVGQLTSARPF